MKLSPKDIDWWCNHTNQEIVEKYGITVASVVRTKKKYSIKNIRKSVRLVFRKIRLIWKLEAPLE